MQWFTVCGFDGNRMVTLHIQGETVFLPLALAEQYLGATPDFAFVGKIKNLVHDAPVVELDENGQPISGSNR